MADPFSVGAGIIGVLGLTSQISSILYKFGHDWKNAPSDVKAFRLELQNLHATLAEMQKMLFANPSFEEAFEDNSSALLLHLKADDISKDSIKQAFEQCQAQLTTLVVTLKEKEKKSGSGWERLKGAFSNKETEKVILQLGRQCRVFEKLISIDTALLTAKTLVEVRKARKEYQEWHIEEENHNILQWLSSFDFGEKHRDILSKLHPGTGQWLLEMDEFKAWRNGQDDCPPNMWCPGIPGAGKTVLSANVVNHLQQVFDQENVAVLYIYCDYKDQIHQTDRNLFASLAQQSILQQKDLPSEAKDLFACCKRSKTSPSSEQCLHLLNSSLNYFRRTFIVLDALDELRASDEDGFSPQIPLLHELSKVQEKVPRRCTMFITSREMYSIQEQFPNKIRLDIGAKDADIRSYVGSYICDERKFAFASQCRDDSVFATEIVEKLVEKAQGMFLLPRLHISHLGNQTRVSKVRKALDSLPSKLDDTYENAMDRIQHQQDEHCQLAMKTLSWISRTQRPLQLEELQHAISVEFGDKDIEDGPLESAALIVSVCAGLVTVDAESRNFRLVHYTVEEYFEKSGYKWFPDADKLVAETCLTYLSFDSFAEGICKKVVDFVARIRKYALLPYAANHWATHVGQADLVLDDVKAVALKFLGNEFKVAAAQQASLMRHGESPGWGIMPNILSSWERGLGIFLIVRCNCVEFAAAWSAWGEDIEKTLGGWTPLQESVDNENLEMTKCLIESGADVNGSRPGLAPIMLATSRLWPEGIKLLLDCGADPRARDRRRSTCLHLTNEFSRTRGRDYQGALECIDLLLSAGLNLEARNDDGNTPLMTALRQGCSERARHLLQRGAAITDDRNGDGCGLLILAVKCPCPDLVELFIRSGQQIDAVDDDGSTALMFATRNGREEIVKLLLQSGADVNAADKGGKTALMFATRNGREEIVKLLLQAGADVNAADKGGKTALMFAIRNGREEIVKLLLQSGADVNAVDKGGETALREVVGTGDYKEILRLLLQAGAKIDEVDRYWFTALVKAARDSGSRDFEILLQFGDYMGATGQNGQTSLMVAVQRVTFAIHDDIARTVELLLQSGANVNAVDERGTTALMMVSQKCAGSEVAKLLLQHGADVNAADERGMTALMIASQNPACGEIIELLLQFGADVDAVEINGQTVVGEVVRKMLHDGEMNIVKKAKHRLHEYVLVKCKGDKVETAAMFSRILRLGYKNILKILLSGGVSEQSRNGALTVATSEANTDENLIQMLSTPPDMLRAMALTSTEKDDLDLLDRFSGSESEDESESEDDSDTGEDSEEESEYDFGTGRDLG